MCGRENRQQNAMLDAGFVETMKNDAGSLLELDCDATPPAADIVAIVAHDIEMPSAAGLSSKLAENASDGVAQPRPAAS